MKRTRPKQKTENRKKRSFRLRINPEEKKAFEAEYAAKLEAYKAAMKDYVPSSDSSARSSCSRVPEPEPELPWPAIAAKLEAYKTAMKDYVPFVACTSN